MIIKKKGVSTVVATVLVILITLVAAVLVGSFVIPFIRDSLNKGGECVNYRGYFAFESSSKYNCYLKSGNNYNYIVSINALEGAKSSDAEQIGGFDLLFYQSDGSSSRVKVRATGSDSGISFGVSGETGIKIPNPGEWMTYNYTTTKAFNKVEVYPALKSGSICSSPDSAELSIKCS